MIGREKKPVHACLQQRGRGDHVEHSSYSSQGSSALPMPGRTENWHMATWVRMVPAPRCGHPWVQDAALGIPWV